MPKCVVVGVEGKAREVRDLLNTSDVPTEAFAHNFGIARIADSCSKMKGLKVVAVFCGDCGMDGGIKLFTTLKNMLNESVALHALLEANEDQSMLDLLNETGVEEVSFALPLNPFKAASFIKRRWFPKNGSEVAAASVPSRVINVAWQVNEPDREEDDEEVSVTVAKPAAPAIARRPMARVPRATAPIADGSDNILDRLMQKTRRNDPLSREPKVVSIVGKHGQVVQIDPRRIRPLPENPRGEDSPGLSETSLRKLGTQIRTMGQQEEAMVCPIVGDSDFDAQLVDGERRQRATKLVEVMIWVTVREDITPKEAEKLYLISVMRNLQKERPTTREYIRIVSNLRGPKYDMSLARVSECIGLSVTRVQQLEMLSRLHPSVQKMLDDNPDDEGKKFKGMARRFTSQLALLLVDISEDKQCSVAEKIKRKKMNYATARRFVYNIRRGLGLTRTPEGVRRQSRQFESLATLVLRSMETFGIFVDMSANELAPVLASRKAEERNGVCQNLRSLIRDLDNLVKRIEKEGAIK